MIVGTAGHIDHGKTSLVRALTGIDTDRLPEEKKRGITIELGYAALPVPGAEPIAFVDVPGHEKLVRTMVAGASGVDYALLLVAADDGVMPQTREHLSILSLLGLRQGLAVLTKADRVDEQLLAQRRAQVQALLQGSSLSGAEVLAVSALRGDGMVALRERLLQQARVLRDGAARADAAMAKTQGFRMALDRVFSLDGVGTVVAGSVGGGQVSVGHTLCLAHQPGQSYRVRSLHGHGKALDGASAGQRCAIGLAGLERQSAQRGQTLCDPAIAQASARLDVWLQLADSEERPLKSGCTVHLHLGTQDVMATVALLGAAQLAPGQAMAAQIVSREPVPAWWGDRLVLRDASASRTLGGGRVLDPQGLPRYRSRPERLAYLQALLEPDARARLLAALAPSPFGIDATAWLRREGWTQWPFEPSQLEGVVEGEGWLISALRLRQAESTVLTMLREFHAKYSEDIGPDLRRARALALPRMPEPLWNALLAQLVREGHISRRAGFIHLVEHGAQLRQAEKIVAQRVLPLLLDGRFDPPWVRDIAGTMRLPEVQVRSVLARLGKSAEVFQVCKDLYYHPQVVQELAELARQIAERDGQVLAASFRDATGLGRKRAIQILEFFDRVGFLRRVGDAHLLRPATLLFPAREGP
jgi:selenocysteine-specific elongation factor